MKATPEQVEALRNMHYDVLKRAVAMLGQLMGANTAATGVAVVDVFAVVGAEYLNDDTVGTSREARHTNLVDMLGQLQTFWQMLYDHPDMRPDRNNPAGPPLAPLTSTLVN